MTRFAKTIWIVFSIWVLCGLSAAAQETEQNELTINRLNRINSVMFITRQALRENSIEIEAWQRDQVDELMHEFKALEPLQGELFQSKDWDALQRFEAQLAGFELRLRVEILTPLQNERLEQIEFETRLQSAHGNLSQVLTRFYADQLGLSKRQIDGLKGESKKVMQSL